MVDARLPVFVGFAKHGVIAQRLERLVADKLLHAVAERDIDVEIRLFQSG